MKHLSHLVAGSLAALAVGVGAHSRQEDACARLTRAEAEAVLSAPVGEPRVAVQDLATECSYHAAESESQWTTLVVAVYETGRAGLRGSAADYFTQTRQASMHIGMPMRSVDVGDEAYWMGSVLHVRKGRDLSLAIEIIGAAGRATAAAEAGQTLALSTKAAAIILGKLDTLSATREALTIATNTQAHREDLRIAVGNIWEEAYTPEGGERRVGLTAMLEVGVPEDASRRQRIRVHPGQTLRVFGYVIQIVSVERSGVRLTLEREPPQRER